MKKTKRQLAEENKSAHQLLTEVYDVLDEAINDLSFKQLLGVRAKIAGLLVIMSRKKL